MIRSHLGEGLFLISEVAKQESLSQAALHSAISGDPEILEEAAEQHYQHCMAQRQVARQMLSRLKAMSWEELFEHAGEMGMEMFLCYGATKFIGFAGRQFASQVAKLKDAAEFERAVSAIGGGTSVLQDSVVGMKLSIEHGADVVQNVTSALAKDAEFVGSEVLGNSFKDKVVNFLFAQSSLY